MLILDYMFKNMFIGFWVGLIFLEILWTKKNVVNFVWNPNSRYCDTLVFPTCVSAQVLSVPYQSLEWLVFSLSECTTPTSELSLFFLPWGLSGSHIFLGIGTLLSGLDLDTSFCSWAQEWERKAQTSFSSGFCSNISCVSDNTEGDNDNRRNWELNNTTLSLDDNLSIFSECLTYIRVTWWNVTGS